MADTKVPPLLDGDGKPIICEARGCSEPATLYDEDGAALCEDCAFEKATQP